VDPLDPIAVAPDQPPGRPHRRRRRRFPPSPLGSTI
jgi:hypothetical protein